MSALWQQLTTYTAAMDRQLIRGLHTEGKLHGLVVTSTGGYDISVSAGAAIVDGDDSANQGSYLAYHTAATALTVAARPASNSRRDLVIMEVEDTADGHGSLNRHVIRIVTGTAAASPVDPTLPATATILARITVASTDLSLSAANINNLAVNPSQPRGIHADPALNPAGTGAANWLVSSSAGLRVDPVRSVDAGNILETRANGLYVPTPAAFPTGVLQSWNSSPAGLTLATPPQIAVSVNHSATDRARIAYISGTFDFEVNAAGTSAAIGELWLDGALASVQQAIHRGPTNSRATVHQKWHLFLAQRPGAYAIWLVVRKTDASGTITCNAIHTTVNVQSY